MNRAENVSIELANDGMIVRDPASANAEMECYVIPSAALYTDRTNCRVRPVPLSHLWLIWFGSLPLLAAIIYMLVRIFGS